MKYTEKGHDGESNLSSWKITTKRDEDASKISHHKSDVIYSIVYFLC